MELKEAIYGRRSVRKYSDRMVEDDVLKEIMEAAMWAPSGVNLQPWYYVVVRTPESMARFRQVMTKVSEGNRAHLEERFAAHPEVAESSIAFIRNMGNVNQHSKTIHLSHDFLAERTQTSPSFH
jgi:nitroreductase